MRILKLTLKKAPFEVMVTGEKTSEYRTNSKWMISRIYGKNGFPKQYDYVEFTNGYGGYLPKFLVEFKGFHFLGHGIHTEPYSNGFHIGYLPSGTIEIKLGKVVKIENYNL